MSEDSLSVKKWLIEVRSPTRDGKFKKLFEETDIRGHNIEVCQIYNL